MPRNTDIEKQVCAALDALIDRTNLAYQALTEERFDRFERCMKRRKAAFHNFSAIDGSAKTMGIDISKIPLINEKVENFAESDKILTKQMSDAASIIRAQIAKINGGRLRINKYRSVQQVVSGFAQTA